MDELKLGPRTMQLIVNALVKPLVDKLTPVVEQTTEQRLVHDQILTKGQLAKKLFDRQNYKAIDVYINQPGFPVMPKTNSDQQDRFSLRAVEKWIAENQQYK